MDQDQGKPTRKLPAAGEERLYVVLVEAVVLQHVVELQKVLDVTLERHLLPPATCTGTARLSTPDGSFVVS